MSVFDYRNAVEFTDYETCVLRMLVYEYCYDRTFDFLDDIDLDEIRLFWYEDRNPDVLGGYYFLCSNRIFLNKGAVQGDPSTWAGRLERVVAMFPVIMHEMVHYWQRRRYGLLYVLLQIPFVRDITIERNAYAVQDALYGNQELVGGSLLHYAKMKRKHGFPVEQFDDIEIAMLRKDDGLEGER